MWSLVLRAAIVVVVAFVVIAAINRGSFKPRPTAPIPAVNTKERDEKMQVVLEHNKKLRTDVLATKGSAEVEKKKIVEKNKHIHDQIEKVISSLISSLEFSAPIVEKYQ